MLAVSAGLNTSQRQSGQAEWQSLPAPCVPPLFSSVLSTGASCLVSEQPLCCASPVLPAPSSSWLGPREACAVCQGAESRNPRVEGSTACGWGRLRSPSFSLRSQRRAGLHKAEVQGEGQDVSLRVPLCRVWDQRQSLVPEDKHPGRWASSKQITLPCRGAGAAENTGVGGEKGGHRSVGGAGDEEVPTTGRPPWSPQLEGPKLDPVQTSSLGPPTPTQQVPFSPRCSDSLPGQVPGSFY